MDVSGERELWCAVIEQAISDYRGDPGSNQNRLRIKNEAAFWLFRSPETGIGSLQWICHQLSYSISYIRDTAKGKAHARVR